MPGFQIVAETTLGIGIDWDGDKRAYFLRCHQGRWQLMEDGAVIRDLHAAKVHWHTALISALNIIEGRNR